MKLYAAFDLHARSSHLGVVDEQGKKVFMKKLPNNTEIMTCALEPYREGISAIEVESTFNWYWLVDALMESGYPVRLANPVAIQKYKGLERCEMAGRNVASGDSAPGLYLSSRAPTRAGSAQKENASGEAQNISCEQSGEHHRP